MQITEQKIDIESSLLKNCLQALPCPPGDICFFDIETTGLSPHVSSLYLIGAAWYAEGVLMLRQWFADDYISEKEILSSFAAFAGPFSTFIHYNGSTFDIPYLEKKYLAHGLPSPFCGKESLDLYRLAGKKKKWFGTANMKLTTMERFLRFQRNDSFTGKDCIQLYTEFMQKKYFRDSLMEERRTQLMLHNHDDLLGTVLCCQLLYYTSYRPSPQPLCSLSDQSLIMSDTLEGKFPVSLEVEQDSIHYSFRSRRLSLSIPLYQGTLYHFYTDYKNYYYLPEEDTAVHKSVGVYVDPAHRRKASAANCYTKKNGLFLPLPQKFLPEQTPLFRKERRGRTSFCWLDPEKEPALSRDFLCGFLSHLFS